MVAASNCNGLMLQHTVQLWSFWWFVVLCRAELCWCQLRHSCVCLIHTLPWPCMCLGSHDKLPMELSTLRHKLEVVLKNALWNRKISIRLWKSPPKKKLIPVWVFSAPRRRCCSCFSFFSARTRLQRYSYYSEHGGKHEEQRSRQLFRTNTLPVQNRFSLLEISECQIGIFSEGGKHNFTICSRVRIFKPYCGGEFSPNVVSFLPQNATAACGVENVCLPSAMSRM